MASAPPPDPGAILDFLAAADRAHGIDELRAAAVPALARAVACDAVEWREIDLRTGALVARVAAPAAGAALMGAVAAVGAPPHRSGFEVPAPWPLGAAVVFARRGGPFTVAEHAAVQR